MVMQRFFSLFERASEISFNIRRNFISPSGIYYNINNSEIPNHFTFTAKGTIYKLTVAMVIFSQMKISCYFHM